MTFGEKLATMYNPSLREEPRDQPAPVIPPTQGSSLLDWLEASGRLSARGSNDFDYLDSEEEIADLMGASDADFDDDDDDLLEDDMEIDLDE